MKEKNVLVVGGPCQGMRVVVEAEHNRVVFRIPPALSVIKNASDVAEDVNNVEYVLHDIKVHHVAEKGPVEISLATLEGESPMQALKTILDVYSSTAQAVTRVENEDIDKP